MKAGMLVRGIVAALALSLIGCSIFDSKPEESVAPPPYPSSVDGSSLDGNSENAAQDPGSAQLEDAWRNKAGLRWWFGDFDPTDKVYVIDPKAAQALVQRGGYLVQSVAACGSCHGATPGDARAPLTGGRLMKDRFGTVRAANITPDPQTGIGSWNVFEVMRVLRAGIDRKGRPVSIDLHSGYRWLADSDAKAIALYLFSLPPVHSAVERRELGAFERNKWGIFPQHHEVRGYVPLPSPGVSYQYGRYLANNVARCASCHTADGGLFGATPFAGFGRRGGFVGLYRDLMALFSKTEVPSETALAPLLSEEGKEQIHRKQEEVTGTPAEQEVKTEEIYREALDEGNFPVLGPDIRGTSESGLAAWSDDDIVSYLSTGVGPDGEVRERRFCPWPSFASMTDDSKRAIAAYLKRL